MSLDKNIFICLSIYQSFQNNTEMLLTLLKCFYNTKRCKFLHRKHFKHIKHCKFTKIITEQLSLKIPVNSFSTIGNF